MALDLERLLNQKEVFCANYLYPIRLPIKAVIESYDHPSVRPSVHILISGAYL